MNAIKNANTIEAAAHHEAGHAAIMYRFWCCIGEGGITTDLFTPGNGNVASRLEVFFKGQSDLMRSLGTQSGELGERRYSGKSSWISPDHWLNCAILTAVDPRREHFSAVAEISTEFAI